MIIEISRRKIIENNLDYGENIFVVEIDPNLWTEVKDFLHERGLPSTASHGATAAWDKAYARVPTEELALEINWKFGLDI
jgi:hypothetical protein